MLGLFQARHIAAAEVATCQKKPSASCEPAREYPLEPCRASGNILAQHRTRRQPRLLARVCSGCSRRRDSTHPRASALPLEGRASIPQNRVESVPTVHDVAGVVVKQQHPPGCVALLEIAAGVLHARWRLRGFELSESVGKPRQRFASSLAESLQPP